MCGLGGIINYEHKEFDYKTFCTLGIANDKRGGDSCGIFIDGKVEYGIGDKAHFEDFFWDSELLKETKEAHIALLHDRKASVGGVSLEKAHPILIKEKVEVAEGEEPREEIKFVLVHNGTIHNYEDLAKKYIPNIDVKNLSDSQVIALLLYHSGFDFLAEYNGGAAFVAVDYRKETPEVLLWRGESKKFSSSTEVEEERPLFVTYDHGRLVFSSICSYLEVLDGPAYYLPGNKICTYKNGKIWIKKEIDRSKCQQNKVYTGTTFNTDYTGHEYWRGNTYTPSANEYLRAFEISNEYRIKGVLAEGCIKMTSFGKVLGKYDSYTTVEGAHKIWFFAGIPLMEEKAFKFLCKAHKMSKLSIHEFVRVYQNFIRYFSVDRLYRDSGLCYKATKPFERELFTGILQMLSESVKHRFEDGVQKDDYITGNINDAFKVFSEPIEFDYKNIWKEFIQSME